MTTRSYDYSRRITFHRSTGADRGEVAIDFTDRRPDGNVQSGSVGTVRKDFAPLVILAPDLLREREELMEMLRDVEADAETDEAAEGGRCPKISLETMARIRALLARLDGAK